MASRKIDRKFIGRKLVLSHSIAKSSNAKDVKNEMLLERYPRIRTDAFLAMGGSIQYLRWADRSDALELI